MALPAVRLPPESRPKLQRPSSKLSVPSKSPLRPPRNAPPWALFKPGHHSSEVALLCDGRSPSQGCSGSPPNNQVFVRRRGPPRSRVGTRVTCREQSLWQRRPARAAVAQRRLSRDARLPRPRRSAHRCTGRGRLGVAGWRRWGCGPNHAWAQQAGRWDSDTRRGARTQAREDAATGGAQGVRGGVSQRCFPRRRHCTPRPCAPCGEKSSWRPS